MKTGSWEHARRDASDVLKTGGAPRIERVADVPRRRAQPRGLASRIGEYGETGIVTSTYSFRRKDNDGNLSEGGPRLTARGALPLRDERRLREAGRQWGRGIAIDNILDGSLKGIDAA